PVSYSACSLAFTFILYRSSQRTIFLLLLKLTSESPLTSSFLLNSPSLPLSPPSIVHCTVLCLTRPRTCTCTHT
ncbi:hypothetical protein BGY98DRAFT_1055156, partial [Russula aff. rugulosa BPL654]